MSSASSGMIAAYCACMHEWNASYEEYARSRGLSYTSLSVLSAIYDMEQCTQKRLCERCLLPKQTVHSIITAFCKKGWICLEELPEDRRNKLICFTPAGRAEAEEILRCVRASERQAMGALSEAEQETLVKLTRRYVETCAAVMREQK